MSYAFKNKMDAGHRVDCISPTIQTPVLTTTLIQSQMAGKRRFSGLSAYYEQLLAIYYALKRRKQDIPPRQRAPTYHT